MKLRHVSLMAEFAGSLDWYSCTPGRSGWGGSTTPGGAGGKREYARSATSL